ncbi:unnamed protein product [Clonostachys solani]|uniref:SRR1-like domain-containing protein n=1 Tax=Clonostachys solani TaxID=160281 RepID=A0A9N9ZDY6_9HYPO|nr:unnamed protein product [Clonostachys solani]
MAAEKQEKQEPIDSPTQVLDYACKPWRLSSQRVADLYHSGTAFWSKADLEDIERQLEQSFHLEVFTLRDLEGKQIQIKNPVFQVERPIWRPYVRYQDYWPLVLYEPETPEELHKCSYIIGWRNTAGDGFQHKIENWHELFEIRSQLWNTSITCKSLKMELSKLLFESQYLRTRKITKVICFGLGDWVGGPHMEIYKSKREISFAQIAFGPITQHVMAFTIAEEIRRYNPGVRLIAQDPAYRDCAVNFLQERGFEVKGQFGAGAFVDVDDESLVISASASAPIRQIVADIAKPAMFIGSFYDGGIVADDKRYVMFLLPQKTSKCVIYSRLIFRNSMPFLDADSPRTMEMWESYDRIDFPISRMERELLDFGRVLKVSMFSRK